MSRFLNINNNMNPNKTNKTNKKNKKSIQPKLSKRTAERTIAGQAQYGQPAKEKSSGQTRKGPPPKVSNRPALSREKGHTEPISRKQATLKVEKQRTSRSQASSATVQQKPSSSPLKNRFDFPLTPREINQLRLGQLKGTGQQRTQELLNTLLAQSSKLAHQLKPKPVVAESPVVVKTEPELKDKLTSELLEAQDDAQYLELEYPKQQVPEQQAGLSKLRQKYGAGKKANPTHIQKLIRDKLAEIRAQLQTL
jgi:hypothetical protein